MTCRSSFWARCASKPPRTLARHIVIPWRNTTQLHTLHYFDWYGNQAIWRDFRRMLSVRQRKIECIHRKYVHMHCVKCLLTKFVFRITSQTNVCIVSYVFDIEISSIYWKLLNHIAIFGWYFNKQENFINTTWSAWKIAQIAPCYAISSTANKPNDHFIIFKYHQKAQSHILTKFLSKTTR